MFSAFPPPESALEGGRGNLTTSHGGVRKSLTSYLHKVATEHAGFSPDEAHDHQRGGRGGGGDHQNKLCRQDWVEHHPRLSRSTTTNIESASHASGRIIIVRQLHSAWFVSNPPHCKQQKEGRKSTSEIDGREKNARSSMVVPQEYEVDGVRDNCKESASPRHAHTLSPRENISA